MDQDTDRLKAIWSQEDVAVVIRTGEKGKKLRVRLPHDRYADPLKRGAFKHWIRNGKHSIPVWVDSKKYWEIPVKWFNDLINRCLQKYGCVYIIQPYREYEKCAPACRRAKGHECSCSCMGANHGHGEGRGWFDVSDAFSVRWGSRHLASRLLHRRVTSAANQ